MVRSMVVDHMMGDVALPDDIEKHFDMTNLETRRLVSRCKYDLDWLTEDMAFSLGECLVYAQKYSRRRDRLHKIASQLNKLNSGEILELLKSSKVCFGTMETLFAATRNRSTFKRIATKNIELLVGRGVDTYQSPDHIVSQKH